MADDPLYPRIITTVDLGTIDSFDPLPLSEVPERMLAKLGAPPTISAKDMLVEQELNKSIRVYFLKTETDDEYNARILALQTQAAADAKIAQKANEENIHWQKFLQLAEKFKDRVDLTILDKKPADLTIKK